MTTVDGRQPSIKFSLHVPLMELKEVFRTLRGVGMSKRLFRSDVALAILTCICAAGPAKADYMFTTVNDPSAVQSAGGSYVHGINDAGQLSGFYYDATGTHGFLDSAGSFITIDDPTGLAGTTYITGMNNIGQLVGYSSDVSGNGRHGFIYKNGNFTIVNDPLASNNTSLWGINDLGDAIGFYGDINGNYHSFLDHNGIFSTFDDPLATAGTFANGINDAGQIVGHFVDNAGIHDFLDANGVFTTINDPSPTAASGTTAGSAINNAGEIVGYSWDNNGVRHAFLDASGVFTTVNDPAGTSGYTEAFAINNANQFAGAFYDGTWHGYVATPVPEPVSMTVLGTGLVGLCLVRRRARAI